MKYIWKYGQDIRLDDYSGSNCYLVTFCKENVSEYRDE